MFRIGHVRHVPVPAITAAAAFIALRSGRAGVIIFIDHAAGPWPALDWLLIDFV